MHDADYEWILQLEEGVTAGILEDMPRCPEIYEEQKEWLLKNTSYFMGEASDEFKPEKPEDLD
jgi:hypothetical protein